MVPGAPSFAALAHSQGTVDVPLYLPLLNLDDGAAEAIIAVREAVDRSVDVDAELIALLSERNWRPHLPAALACALGYGGHVSRVALWRTFGESWVAPQLAVAASRGDPQFEEEARVWLLECAGEARQLGRGLAQVGKRVAALAFLCQDRSTATWLEPILARPEVQAALREDAHNDRGGAVARHWLGRLVTLSE